MASRENFGLVGSPDDLDPSLYKLTDEEADFVCNQTGIKDPVELQDHLLQVQREAYAVSSRFICHAVTWRNAENLLGSRSLRMPVFVDFIS